MSLSRFLKIALTNNFFQNFKTYTIRADSLLCFSLQKKEPPYKTCPFSYIILFAIIYVLLIFLQLKLPYQCIQRSRLCRQLLACCRGLFRGSGIVLHNL